MVLSSCAGVVLLVALANCVTCGPTFRRTRKGWLSVHWCLANFLSSIPGGDFGGWPDNASQFQLILSFATIAILVDYILTFEQPGHLQYSLPGLLCVGALLVSIDWCLWRMSPVQKPLIECGIFAGLVLTAAGALTMNRSFEIRLHEPAWTYEGLLALHHDDFFTRTGRPFESFGVLGALSFASILGCSAIQVFPILQSLPLLVYILFVTRSVSTLGLLFIPAYYGGAVQSVKTFARTAIAIVQYRRVWGVKSVTNVVDA